MLSAAEVPGRQAAAKADGRVTGSYTVVCYGCAGATAPSTTAAPAGADAITTHPTEEIKRLEAKLKALREQAQAQKAGQLPACEVMSLTWRAVRYARRRAN